MKQNTQPSLLPITHRKHIIHTEGGRKRERDFASLFLLTLSIFLQQCKLGRGQSDPFVLAAHCVQLWSRRPLIITHTEAHSRMSGWRGEQQQQWRRRRQLQQQIRSSVSLSAGDCESHEAPLADHKFF